MSVEGLLCEVSAILGSRLAVKAADQAFFGGKQVYTDVSPSTEGCSKGSNEAGQKSGDNLKSAIENAKQIVNSALAGQAPASGSNEKVFAEIAALKKENQSIKDELSQLRKLVEQLSVSGSGAKLGFGSASTILVLGDGNLSFSLSLARTHNHVRITATVLESEQEFLDRYTAEDTVIALRRCSNVTLLFGVDATKLRPEWKGMFDTIIMNFPHPGGKTNLRRSRLLLSGVFKSVRTILGSGASFHLALANGQAGFSLQDVRWSVEPPPHNPDSWQAVYLAAEEGLRLDEVHPMLPCLFPGYRSSGYLSTGKGFNNWKEAHRLVFSLIPRDLLFDEIKKLEPPRNTYSLYSPFYLHDISLLFSCAEISISEYERIALQTVKDIAGNMIVAAKEVVSLRSMCPNPFLPNRIYRLGWQPSSIPLSKRTCTLLQDELRRRLVLEFNERELPLILT